MFNLSMPAKRQGEAARFLSASSRAPALFLLSSVVSLFDQPPAGPASPGDTAPAKARARARAPFATVAQRATTGEAMP